MEKDIYAPLVIETIEYENEDIITESDPYKTPDYT